MEEKILMFDHFIFLMECWYDEATNKNDAIENAFTKLSLLKLLFLTAATKTENEYDLLDIFNNFVALPYGPVEVDIYQAMKDDLLPNYTVNDRSITRKNKTYICNNQVNTNKILNAVNELKKINFNLIKYDAFALVDITHQWNCWIVDNMCAEMSKKPYWKMSIDSIRNERNKLYGYNV